MFDFCLSGRIFIIIRPDLLVFKKVAMVKIRKDAYLPPGFFCFFLGEMSITLLASETHSAAYLSIIKLLRPWNRVR